MSYMFRDVSRGSLPHLTQKQPQDPKKILISLYRGHSRGNKFDKSPDFNRVKEIILLGKNISKKNGVDSKKQQNSLMEWGFMKVKVK